MRTAVYLTVCLGLLQFQSHHDYYGGFELESDRIYLLQWSKKFVVGYILQVLEVITKNVYCYRGGCTRNLTAWATVDRALGLLREE